MQEQNRHKWTPEEEIRLMELSSFYGMSNIDIGKQLGGLSGGQIRDKKRTLLTAEGKMAKKREPFSLEEDIMLLRCCLTYRNVNGRVTWSKVIVNLPGRSKIQCRDRWLNHLSPDINKKPWTREENEIVIKTVEEFGPNDKTYALLRKQLNRSLNSIRNHYSKTLRQIIRSSNTSTLKQQLNESRLLTQKLEIVTADINTLPNEQKQNGQSQSNSKIILPSISEIFDQVGIYNTNELSLLS